MLKNGKLQSEQNPESFSYLPVTIIEAEVRLRTVEEIIILLIILG